MRALLLTVVKHIRVQNHLEILGLAEVIPEYPELEGTQKDHQVQPLALQDPPAIPPVPGSVVLARIQEIHV